MGTPTQSTRSRRGPMEGEHVIGVDADPARRPGVPMHARPGLGPSGTSPPRATIEPQTQPPKLLYRAALDHPTPVYGTGQPPRGISGALRSAAYDIPEHRAQHWMLLLLADRVDVLEDRIANLAARPLEAAGATGAAESVRRNPVPMVAGLAVGLWVAKKVLT